MFTGLIRAVAPVISLTSRPGAARLTLDLGPLAAQARHGDSFAVDGACLTIAELSGQKPAASIAHFDIVPETLARTTLGRLRPHDLVNLEPALRVGDPLGGHFVLGHVDAIGTVQSITRTADTAIMTVRIDPTCSLPPAACSLLVPKGSIAVHGVSLTLIDVLTDSFTCALIPTTLADTTLGRKRPGDPVNIETDILAKHIARLLAATSPASRHGTLTLDKLRDAGFA